MVDEGLCGLKYENEEEGEIGRWSAVNIWACAGKHIYDGDKLNPTLVGRPSRMAGRKREVTANRVRESPPFGGGPNPPFSNNLLFWYAGNDLHTPFRLI